MRKVDFYRHDLTAADAHAVADVIASPFLTTGPVSRRVEELLCGYFDAPHALLVNSWTNGALALLLSLELKPGDEVIIPAMTFIATANVVVLAGGTPVFVDVDPATLLLTPEAVIGAVTKRSRAVIPVHLYGQMCDIKRMREQLDPAIVLIEDCAHCFEGLRDGYRPSVHSDAAVFSFYATKNVTCGEGGAIVLRNQSLMERTRETRLHGMSAIAADRFSGGKYNHWDMKRLGTKANLPDLLAALLPPQIASINAKLSTRTAVADRYRRAFANGPLRLVEQLPNCVSAEHLFPIGIRNGQRDRAIELINEAGISVTVNYRSVPDTTYYRERLKQVGNRWPVSRQWGEETLTLPLFPSLTPDEQEYILETIRRVIYPIIEDASSL